MRRFVGDARFVDGWWRGERLGCDARERGFERPGRHGSPDQGAGRRGGVGGADHSVRRLHPHVPGAPAPAHCAPRTTRNSMPEAVCAPDRRVSGFNGAGKTFVLRHLLRHKCTDADEISPEELRVGVICSTNTDAKLLRRKEKEVVGKDVLRSTHSCPCCVEEKLSKDLASLIQQGEEDDHESPIDRVLVECGWASPRTLRNRLQEAKEQGIEDAQKFVVDSMVSVIDASKIQELWETSEILADRPELDGFAESNLNGPPVAGAENYAKRRVSELLAEQIECADVVVLTKMELVPPEQRDFVRALLRLLLPPNPGSIVVPVESGADPSPHLAERVWIDSDWERTVATNTNEDDYKDCVARAREVLSTREELLWWPPAALSAATTLNDTALDIESCSEGMQVRVLRDENACRAAVKACDGLEEGSWEFDLMDQRLGAPGMISEVEQEDAIVEVNFGRWDERARLSTFVYVQRKPFHPTRLEGVVKQLPTRLGCPCGKVEGELKKEVEELKKDEEHTQTCFDAVVRSKGFVWLATFHTAALYWDHSGGHFSLINIGQWWAATDGGMEGHSDEFEGEFGDRRQELVFIGVDLDTEAIAKSLDACLLDDKELSYYRQHFMNSVADKPTPGPLPGMPSGVPVRSPDDREPQKRGSSAPAAGMPAKPHGSEESAHSKTTAEKASAKSRHDEGNNAFRREDYKLAIKLYSQAIGLCEHSKPRGTDNQRSRRVPGASSGGAPVDSDRVELLERKATLLTNRAECYLRTQNFPKALADCEAALAVGIPNWPKQGKTESRMKIAIEKLGAEKNEKAKLAEQRRVAQAREKKDEVAREREKQAKRQAQLEAESLAAEAKRIEDELARDLEAEEERARQRQVRSQQRDTTQEKLNEAKALWDKAEAQMRNAARIQRQAVEATAVADRKQADMKKRENRIKEKEARVAEDEKKLKQKHKHAEQRAKQLESQEAKLARDRSEFQTDMQRRQQELNQREERLRMREQQIERQRVGATKHDKGLQQQDRHQKDTERALKERKRRLDAMQEALDSRERELRNKEKQKQPVDKPEQQLPAARTGHMGDADTKSWPTTPPLGPSQSSKHSGTADVKAGTGVSRFFPAQIEDADNASPLKHAELPESYCCPITRQLMREPVVACDGHTYEQRAIEEWLSQKHVSPMTGERMNDHTVVPNRLLQNQIAQFIAHHKVEGAPSSLNHHVAPNNSHLESSFNPALGLTPGPTVRPMALGTSLFGQVDMNGESSSGGAAMTGTGRTPGGFVHSLGTATGADSGGGSTAFGQEGLMGIDGLLGWNDIGANSADHDSGWSTSSAAALKALDADETTGGATDGSSEDTGEKTRLIKEKQHVNTQQGLTASNGDELDPLAIYVSNINWETTSARLREIFSKNFGPVTHVNLKENKIRRSPSYAFIIFESAESAQKAIAKGSMTVDSRQLKFEPRRLQQKQSHSQQSQPHQQQHKSALVERVGGIRALDPKIGTVAVKPVHAGAAHNVDTNPGTTNEMRSSGGSSIPGADSEQPRPEASSTVGEGSASTGDGERPLLVVKPGCRLFVGLGGGATGEDQRAQLARLFSNYGTVADVEVGFMGCAFVTMTNVCTSCHGYDCCSSVLCLRQRDLRFTVFKHCTCTRVVYACQRLTSSIFVCACLQDEDARAAKTGLHATTPPISGLARKQGLAVEVATHKGYETALKKAGKPIPPATAL